MSAPKPVNDLRLYVERQQASLTDPAERARAMTALHSDVLAILSTVETYLNESNLAVEAGANAEQPDQAPPPESDGADGRDESP